MPAREGRARGCRRIGFSSRAAAGDIVATQLVVGRMERGEKDRVVGFCFGVFFPLPFPGLEFSSYWAQKKKKKREIEQVNREAHRI